ncbi:acnB, partial [Symbiodinium microadriaticum]
MRSQATDKEQPAEATMKEATARLLVDMPFMSETQVVQALQTAGVYACNDDSDTKRMHLTVLDSHFTVHCLVMEGGLPGAYYPKLHSAPCKRFCTCGTFVQCAECPHIYFVAALEHELDLDLLPERKKPGQGARSAAREAPRDSFQVQEEMLLPGSTFSAVVPEKEEETATCPSENQKQMDEAAETRKMRVRASIFEPEYQRGAAYSLSSPKAPPLLASMMRAFRRFPLAKAAKVVQQRALPAQYARAFSAQPEAFKAAYEAHVADRAAEGGLPPLALDSSQAESVVEMLKKAPADGAFYVDLLRNRVNPGVDDSSYVKANFLRDIIHGTVSTPLVSKADAVEMLGWMQGGYNVAPLVEALDLDPELASGAVKGLSRMILMFDAYHDVEDKMKKGNPFAKQVVESWANADWFTSRPTVPEKVTLCVFKVTGETNTDDLSPAPDAWSRPDIPLHALAMLKFPRDGITNASEQIADLKTKGHQLAYVGDVVGTGSSRKSATNSILWYMGQDIPCAPNKRTGGFVIGGVIAPIFFNTMEDSGALPLEMDVKDLNMGDLIDLCVYDQVVKKHGSDEVITKFDLKHGLMLDQVQAGGRIPLIIGRGLTNKARESLNLGMSTTFKQMAQPDVNVKGFTLAQKMVGRACGVDGVVPGAYCEPRMGTVGSQDTTGPMTRDELKDLACLGFQADLVMQSFCHTAAYPRPVDVITHRTLPKFIADRGGVALRPGDGIIHSWLNRMLLPDEVGTGGDSHTRFPLGISFPAGSGLVAFGAATGVMPLNMPESVLVRFSGKMQPGVTLRDLVHAIPYYAIQQGLLTVEKKGKKNIFNGRILEIEGLPDLKCEQAFELSDASAERSAAGCTIKLNEDSVKEYLTSNITLLKWMISEGYSDPRTLARRVSKMEKWLESPSLLEADKEAEYAAVININLDELKEPVLCCPNDPDDAKTLTEIGTAGIDEVFIGSCMTNIGHYRAAGKMLSQFDGQLSTRLWIAPPTKMDEEQLTKEGYYSIYGKVGARTEMPGCSLCMGNQARVADNATVVSTSTRNFPNRLGKGANVYLASAELAAVAAVLGRLPTNEEYLKYHGELAKNEDSIYKYLNFDQVEDYVAKADKEEQEEDEEPIPFAETVWNVALVLGFTDAGWLDILLTLILACMSLSAVSAFMQSLFVLVILSPSFLGEPFESEIQIARTWRANIAHDSKYKDLADTSLASRVCNGDGSLIQSTVQANLLSEIDSFLGIGAKSDPF